jgi:hypothetical protein
MEFAHSYNAAAKMVKEEYLFFLNNDVYVKKDCIERFLERKGKAEIMGGKLLFYDKREIVQEAGIQFLPLGGGYEVGHGERDDGRFDVERYVGGVCGAAMFISRDVFLQLLFDPDFKAYFEDVDLCWRAWLAGKRILYVPSAVIYHKFGGTYDHDSSKTIYISQRNRLQIMIKNFSPFNLVKALPLSLAYDGTKVLKFLAMGKFDMVWAFIGSYLYILINIRHILRKRKKVQEERVISDKELYLKGYIASFSEAKREYERSKRIKKSVAQ